MSVRKLLLALLAAALMLGPLGCRRSPEVRFARYMESGKRYAGKKDFARAIIQFSNAARIKPKDAEAAYQLGLAYLDNRDLRRGVQALRKACELNPRHAAAQLKLAQLMLLSNEKDLLAEAERRTESVLAAGQGDAEALDTLAYAQLRQGRPEDAETHLQEALQKFPAHLKSSVLLATVKLSRRDLAGAETVLKQAVQQAPKQPEPLYALARLYVLTGRLPEADTQYQNALQADPAHAPSLRDLAALRLRQGKTSDAEQLYRRLSQAKDKQYAHLYALFLLSQRRTDAGLAELERLAKADPANRQARSRLVSAYVRSGKPEAATGVLAAALKANQKDLDALSQYGDLLLAQGKVAEAQAKFAQVLHFQPTLPEAHFAMARVYAARGETRRQREELNETLRLGPTLLAARLQLARLFLATGSPKTALDLLNQAPGSQRRQPALRIQRNWALLALGERAEMLKEVDQLLAASRIPEVLLQRAQLSLQEKDFAAARAAAEEILKALPEEQRALDALMASYFAQNQPQQALARLRQQTAQFPKSPGLQAYLGRVLISVGKRDEARAALAESSRLAPAYPAPRLLLAQLDISEGKLDPARGALTQLLAKGENPGARMLLGNLEEVGGRPGAAIQHYRKLLESDSNNALALNNLAYLLADSQNELDQALTFAQQALELAPDNAAVQDTLGWIYYRKGLYGTALPYLEKAAASRDAGARRKYHLSMAYLRAGQDVRGRQVLKDAEKLDPKLPEAQAARQLLEELDQIR